MISEEQLAAYLSDALTGTEQARFEEELAADETALRTLLEQECMDAALRALAGPRSERATLARSILEVVSGPSHEQLTSGVMQQLRWRSISWWRTRLPWATAALAVLALVTVVWMNRRPGDKVPRVAQESSARNAIAAPRDPASWPFAAGSPWNTPIGSDAEFGEVSPGGLDLSAGLFVFNADESHQMFFARTDDPVRDVHVYGPRQPPVKLPIPGVVPFGYSRLATVHLVAPDGVTLHEILQGRLDESGQLWAARVVRADLRGSGVPPEFVSGQSGGLPRLAGSLHRGELDTGIRHALGAVASIEAISLRADGTAHVWPAVRTPGSPAYRARFQSAGNVHVGSLLAIPPEVDLATLGVGTNGPAFEIARALQDYGVYVKESVDWQPVGRPGLVICVALDPLHPLSVALSAQLRRVALRLRVVTNNGPESVGGGASCRRPPAPAFK